MEKVDYRGATALKDINMDFLETLQHGATSKWKSFCNDDLISLKLSCAALIKCKTPYCTGGLQ